MPSPMPQKEATWLYSNPADMSKVWDMGAIIYNLALVNIWTGLQSILATRAQSIFTTRHLEAQLESVGPTRSPVPSCMGMPYDFMWFHMIPLLWEVHMHITVWHNDKLIHTAQEPRADFVSFADLQGDVMYLV